MTDEIKPRLVKCFAGVFPNLTETAIPTASQDTVKEWDSVAAITLVTVIQEEFMIEIDLEELETMTSFPRIHQYLKTRLSATQT